MSRPPVYDANTRARLLAATAEFVAQNGPDRVSLREVARAAETSTSAVYALFGDKGKLLSAVVTEGFASFAASQREAEPVGLRELCVAYRVWAHQNPSLYQLMFDGVLVTHKDEESGGALDPLTRVLAARGAADPLTAALSVWAHVHGAVSLEFARVAPRGLDTEAFYMSVIDSIEQLWPAR